MINISGEYTFSSSRENIWTHLFDPDFLIDIIPGCKALVLGDNQDYYGEIQIGFAGISGSYTTKMNIIEMAPPDYCNLIGEVAGKTGIISGTVDIRMVEQGDNSRMEYEGCGIISGALASINSRYLVVIANTIIRRGLRRIDKRIT